MSETINPRLTGFSCLRCETLHPVGDYFEGCPRCAGEGHAVSVRPLYRGAPGRIAGAGRGCRRYADWLVHGDWPSLGEGGTPLVALPSLAADLGLGSLAVKLEGANPTGSHKDRMSMLAVARARAAGAATVAAASSGNAGVSLAAYAARAGLDCVVVTTPGITPAWRRAIEMHGARLVAADDSLARWAYMRDQVREAGWYPVTNYLAPPVGSNPFGVDGYRTLAFELAEEAEGADHVVVPTARGDLLWGIARGFRDLLDAGLAGRAPRVHAVEPFARASRVRAGADYRSAVPGTTAMASIAGGTVTWQTLDALRLADGRVADVDDATARADQARLARAGLHLELSSAAALSGARALAAHGVIRPGARVVLIGTSHGFKEHVPSDRPIERAG